MTTIDILKSEFERRLKEESLARIRQCVEALTVEELWKRPNENLVSVGNLVLHLSGNIRQYISSGIGGAKDNRNRNKEFETQSPISKDELLTLIGETIEEAVRTVAKISDHELNQEIKVQGFEETCLSVIIHVIEHCSYHVGQITYYTKLTKNIDTAYYGGLDLNITE